MRLHIFPILDNLCPSGYIRDQSRKLCKIGRNFACFWPQNFFKGEPPNFWTCPIKSTLILIMWQNFAVIGQRSSEILWLIKQESPAIADKPARRESLPKLLQFDVPTTLSLTILAYLHAFNCYCVRNPRNPEKFTENSNLWTSRSSKVIDIGVNRKPICDLLLVINSNFSRICYRFRDIHG